MLDCVHRLGIQVNGQVLAVGLDLLRQAFTVSSAVGDVLSAVLEGAVPASFFSGWLALQ